MPAEDDRTEEGSTSLPDLGDHVDMGTFSQILEMDESEDDRDFSKSIVFDFFDQAKETFEKIEKALKEKNLAELSQLGHFLKGSSATLGLSKVKDSCQVIQQYGKKKTVEETDEPDETVCLKKITDALNTVKVDFAEVEKALEKFYNDSDA